MSPARVAASLTRAATIAVSRPPSGSSPPSLTLTLTLTFTLTLTLTLTVALTLTLTLTLSLTRCGAQILDLEGDAHHRGSAFG